MYSIYGDWIVKIFAYLATGIRGIIDWIMTAINLGEASDLVLGALAIVIAIFLVGWIFNSKTVKWMSRGVVAILIFLLLRGLKL